jgi:hypothetical protein
MDELAGEYHETHDPKIPERDLQTSPPAQRIGSLMARELDVETAIAVLEDALNRCRREDMRTPEVFAALDFLSSRASRKWPFDQFRNSLDIANEEGRWQNVNASLNAVKLAVQQRT